MTVYNIFLILRVLIRHKKPIIVMEDTFFWILSSVAIFALLFLLNEGNVRFYALMSVALGMWFQYHLIGKRSRDFVKKVLRKP